MGFSKIELSDYKLKNDLKALAILITVKYGFKNIGYLTYKLPKCFRSYTLKWANGIYTGKVFGPEAYLFYLNPVSL